MSRTDRARALSAVIVLTLLVAGCSSAPSATPEQTLLSSPSTTLEPTAAAEPTILPTDTAPPSYEPTAGGWVAAADDKVSGAQFHDVVWTGQRFVAAGAALTGGGVFVSSANLKRWASVPFGERSGHPTDIAVGPNGVVAVGRVNERPASWISADGIAWTYRAAVFPSSLKGDDVVTVTDVVATSTGWLAVGRDDPICQIGCGQDPLRALAWTSKDAETWTRVPAQASLSKAAMNAVTAVDGGFVAVGEAGGHAAFWTSPGGLTWDRVPDDLIFGPPQGAGPGATVSAVGVATSGGTVVTVGMASVATPDGGPIVLAWRSTDGRTWTQATVERAEEGQVFAVAATTTGFLATGPSGATSCLGGIWSSIDGATWACEASDPGFEGFGPYAAAGSPAFEMAVGLTDVGWDENSGLGLPGAIWFRPVR
jgi:hypothetical protein